jgi:hypothetical protein
MKSFNTSFIISFLSLFCILSLGCKKNKIDYKTIPDDFKQWYLYQQGSYWIYQNNKTSMIDCTYISTPPIFSQGKLERDDGSIYEIDDNIAIYFNCNLIHYCSIDPLEVFLFLYPGTTNNIYGSNFEKGVKYTYSDIAYEYVTDYDSLLINNQYFHNVRCTRDWYGLTSGDTTINTFFYSQHIGLISFNKNYGKFDTTWNLIRFHALQ